MKFGWAVIGCGNIAATVAKEIVKEGSGRIVACWNRTTAKADRFAKRFGGVVYATAKEAITAEGVEGVYIATTNDKHAYYTKLCIELGVPALCEKPFAVNAKEAEEVAGLARAKGVFVAEAMWTWFNKPARAVREWINERKLGKISAAKAQFAFPFTTISKNPRLTSPELIGGAMMDIGIYPVRYFYELFGAPKNVTAAAKLKNGVDATDNVILDYGEFKAEVFVSMTRFAFEGLTVKGENGKISVPSFHSAKVAKLSGKYNEVQKSDPLRYGTQMRLTAEEIRSGKTESEYSPLDKTIETLEILDNIRRIIGVKYPQE